MQSAAGRCIPSIKSMLAHSDPDSVEDDPKKHFHVTVTGGKLSDTNGRIVKLPPLRLEGLKLMLAEPVVGMVRGFRNRLEFVPSDFLDNQMRPW